MYTAQTMSLAIHGLVNEVSVAYVQDAPRYTPTPPPTPGALCFYRRPATRPAPSRAPSAETRRRRPLGMRGDVRGDEVGDRRDDVLVLYEHVLGRVVQERCLVAEGSQVLLRVENRLGFVLSPWFLRETTRVTRMNASRRSSSAAPLRSLARNPGDATSRWRLAYTSSVPSDVASLRLEVLRRAGAGRAARRSASPFSPTSRGARGLRPADLLCSFVTFARGTPEARESRREAAYRSQGRRGDGDGIRHDDVCAGKVCRGASSVATNLFVVWRERVAGDFVPAKRDPVGIVTLLGTEKILPTQCCYVEHSARRAPTSSHGGPARGRRRPAPR